MVKFKTSDVYEYLEEKDKRKLIYDHLCMESTPIDPCKLFERIKNLDRAYLDWQDDVILEK